MNSYITEDHIQALVASGKFTRAEAVRFLDASYAAEERMWKEAQREGRQPGALGALWGMRAQLTTSADRKALQSELSKAGVPAALAPEFVAAGLAEPKAARLFLAGADRDPRGRIAGLALTRLTLNLQARACYSQRNA